MSLIPGLKSSFYVFAHLAVERVLKKHARLKSNNFTWTDYTEVYSSRSALLALIVDGYKV